MAALWRTVSSAAHQLSSARPGYLLAALALYVISLLLAGARWRGFLRALGGRVGVARAALAHLGGISAGNLAPSTRLGGEACRIALVRLAGTATWRQATVAAIWDRLSEVPPIVVLGVMAILAVRRLRPPSAPVLAIGVVIVAAITIVALARRTRGEGTRLARWRNELAADRPSGRIFVAGVGYSTLVWVQDVLRLSCVMLAFGVMLSPTKVATLSILAMLGGLVPGVAGLGPVEGSLVTGLIAFGIDLPTAAAITAAERSISYGFSTCAGALAIAGLGGRSLLQAARTASMPATAGVPVDPSEP